MEKSESAFRTISEVSTDIGVPQHVLRFWETKFPAIKPLKRGGNRRYYRPEDVSLVRAVNRLLYTDGYTIRGVQKLIKDRGIRAVVSGEAQGERAPAEDTPAELPFAAAASPTNAPSTIAALRALRDRLASALDAARL